MTDDSANDRGHFSNGEELRSSRPITLARVARWIGQGSDCNSGDVIERRRCVAAFTRDWQRKDPEMCRERHHF
jgi:hypothetical protein